MRLLDVLILALATWRLASLLAQEDGPGDIFARLRKAAGVRYGPDNAPYGTNSLARGVLCIACNSVWFGAALTLGYYVLGGPWLWFCLPLALSAAAILVERHVSG